MSRIDKIRNAFLEPDFSNIDSLENMIHKIVENILKQQNSQIRIERVTHRNYSEVVKNSIIPSEYSDEDGLIEKLNFYLQGLLKWNSPGVMMNVNPPAMLLPIAASACCSLFNPNLAMDVPAGNLAFAELEVIKMLSDLAGWNYEKSAGVLTFGGKGTVLYAIRAGLNACCPEVRYKGIQGEKIKVISTLQGHPCHYENCEWLGIGKENCIRLPLKDDDTIDLEIAKEVIWQAVKDGNKIACIIANGGSTLYTTVDEIDKIVMLRDRLVEEFNLDYIPHVHVDSVIGWAWLMFKNYDFQLNPLEFSEDALNEIKCVYESIKNVQYADSFGADFHKTGFTHYLCSAFVVRDKGKLYGLGDGKQPPLEELDFGLYAPFSYTLESSRPAISALSAWLSLKQLGEDGFQRIIGTLVEAGCELRKYFSNTNYSLCANKTAHGSAALVMLFPPEFWNKQKENLQNYSEKDLFRIAQFNHKFYLYMLALQSSNEINFALDYVSQHTTVGDIKIGVLKIYPMSPFCTVEYLKDFYCDFEKVLFTFAESWETIELKDSPYRPKPFTIR